MKTFLTALVVLVALAALWLSCLVGDGSAGHNEGRAPQDFQVDEDPTWSQPATRAVNRHAEAVVWTQARANC